MSSKRAHGEGSITQRKDGRWQAALQVDGRRRMVYGRTRQEAAVRLAELKRQAAQSGGLPDPGRRTLGELLGAWLEAKAPTWKLRTLADYTGTCDRYLRPALGDLRLARVTPQRVQRLVGGYQAAGQHRTALKVYRALSQALALAVRWGWLANNPAERVDPPKYHPERKTLWTLDQLAIFLEGTAGHWLAPYYLVAVATGARPSELLALMWADVDAAAGTCTIRRTLQRLGGEWTMGIPKTAAGSRTITLPGEALAALQQQRAWQAAHRLRLGPNWPGLGLVFTTAAGQPIHGTTVSHAMARECDRLGLPRVTPHGLRHLHASLLLAEGLPVPAVSKRLGHANAGVTMTVYAHAIGQGDAGAAEAIGRALRGESTGQ